MKNIADKNINEKKKLGSLQEFNKSLPIRQPTVRCQSQDPRRGSDFVSTNATSQMTPEVKPRLKEGVLTSAIDGNFI